MRPALAHALATPYGLAGIRRLPLLFAAIGLLLITGCAISPALNADERVQVAGRTYVITGASSGFGRGVALQLAALKANLVLAARRAEVLDDVAAQARATGAATLVVPTDVAQAEQVERLAQAAVQHFGRIDVWINNAGVGALGRFEAIPLADHARIVDVNLKGVLHGSHVALRRFKAQGDGTLVNLGSVESVVPLAYQATYAATKHAVLGLGRALNEELRLAGLGDRIRVSTVLPWASDTPFFVNTANYTGGMPRMVLMDGPQKVVDAIVWASVHPVEELPVGWKAHAATLGARWLPDLTEHVAADIYHRVQMEQATRVSPAPPTSGNLHSPVPTGTGIEGGVRERMRREDAQR